MRASLSSTYDKQGLEQLLNAAHEISGYSLREVADLTCLSPAYICQILNGQRHPTRDTLIRLSACGWILSLPEINNILLRAGYKPLSTWAEKEDRLLVR